MALRVPRHFICVSLIFWSGKALSYDVDPASFLKLPKSCQSWFIDAAALRPGLITGMSFAGMKPPMNLDSTIGRARAGMNHYCNGLVHLIRFKDHEHRSMTQKQRKVTLRYILSEIDYLRPSGSAARWFKAEVLRNRGHILSLMGESSRAISAYQSAIEAHPPYLPAYWELATVFEELKTYGRAIRTLENALEHTRKPGYSKKISDRIVRLRKLAAEKDNLQESGTPANVEAPPPAEKSATSSLTTG